MNLRTLRTKMNLTQKQLAEKMETTQQTFARWETGKTPLTSAHIQRLCGILKCSVEELMGWKIDGEEVVFDQDKLFEFGSDFGTLKLGMACGIRKFPIGEVAKDDVEAFLDRCSVLNRNDVDREWMVLTTLHRRLLLVNFAAIQTVGLISDDIEAMPAYEDIEAGSTESQIEQQTVNNEIFEGDPLASFAQHDEIRVTFNNGNEETYLLTKPIAHAVYSILMSCEVPNGSFMMIEDEAEGKQRTYVQLSEVAMLDLPAKLYVKLTSDD